MKTILGGLIALLMILIVYHTVVQKNDEEHYQTTQINTNPTYNRRTGLTTYYTNEGMPCFSINLKKAGVANQTNINTSNLPATHFVRPTMQQCLAYVNKAHELGVITLEQIEPKLITCTQQRCIIPWIKNMGVR